MFCSSLSAGLYFRKSILNTKKRNGARDSFKQPRLSALVLTVLRILIVSFVFINCNGTETSKVFDIPALKEKAAEIVLMINEKSWGEIEALSSEEFKLQFTDDFIVSDIEPYLNTAGNYKFLRGIFFAESESLQTGKKTGIIIIKAKYEKRKLYYTFNFDEQCRLTGMVIRY